MEEVKEPGASMTLLSPRPQSLWVEAKSELYVGETRECVGLGSGHLSDSDSILQEGKPPARGIRFIQIGAEMDFGCVLCELVSIALPRDKFLQNSGFKSLKVE